MGDDRDFHGWRTGNGGAGTGPRWISRSRARCRNESGTPTSRQGVRTSLESTRWNGTGYPRTQRLAAHYGSVAFAGEEDIVRGRSSRVEGYYGNRILSCRQYSDEHRALPRTIDSLHNVKQALSPETQTEKEDAHHCPDQESGVWLC